MENKKLGEQSVSDVLQFLAPGTPIREGIDSFPPGEHRGAYRCGL